MDSDSKINVIILAYAAVLELGVCPTDIEVQKIDRSMILTQGMVSANF